MPDTIENIAITKGEWFDLYALSSIAVGTQLSVLNIGVCDLSITVQATKPPNTHDAYELIQRDNGKPFINDSGDSGLWIYCNNDGGKVNIKIVTDILNKDIKISDESDRVAMVSMTGELQVGFKLDDISVNFQYGISDVDVVDGGVATGTGAVGTLQSMATVSSGLGVGTAHVESRDAVRYRAGHECQCALSIVFGTPEAGVNQYAGFLNGADGWCPGYQGLDFGIWFIEGGNVNFINQDDFNIDKLDGSGQSGYNIDPTKGQLYRPTYTWHGFLDMMLEVRTPDGRWMPVHKEVFVNSAIETHLENPNLPITVKVERLSGSGDDVVIRTGSWRGGVIAGVEENNRSDRWFPAFTIDVSKTNSATNGDHLITLRSKDIYQGKANHIKTEVKIIVSINSTNKELVFFATRMAALDAADQAAIEAAFADVSTANSVMEASKVTRLLITAVPESDFGDVAVIRSLSTRDNTDVQGFNIYPGDDIVFAVLGTGNGTVSLQLNFKELH